MPVKYHFESVLHVRYELKRHVDLENIRTTVIYLVPSVLPVLSCRRDSSYRE